MNKNTQLLLKKGTFIPYQGKFLFFYIKGKPFLPHKGNPIIKLNPNGNLKQFLKEWKLQTLPNNCRSVEHQGKQNFCQKKTEKSHCLGNNTDGVSCLVGVCWRIQVFWILDLIMISKAQSITI